MANYIKFFHLRGGIDYKKLSLVHKSMIAMVKKVIFKKPEDELTEDDKQLLDTYGDKVDFTNKSTIAPLVNYIL